MEARGAKRVGDAEVHYSGLLDLSALKQLCGLKGKESEAGRGKINGRSLRTDPCCRPREGKRNAGR